MEAVLTNIHNLCFEQKSDKYQNFLSENFHFLVVKFSVYLNRHVFVMFCTGHASSYMSDMKNCLEKSLYCNFLALNFYFHDCKFIQHKHSI